MQEAVHFELLGATPDSPQEAYVFHIKECVEFWRTDTKYPRLRLTARHVINNAIGSGVLKNDFTLSGKLLSRLRTSLGSDTFDMTMTLNRNFKTIFTNPGFLNSIEELEWAAGESCRPKSKIYDIPLQPKKKKREKRRRPTMMMMMMMISSNAWTVFMTFYHINKYI